MDNSYVCFDITGTPPARRDAPARRLIRFAPHIPLRGMFVAVDRTHTMRTVPVHPRHRADALTRYEYGLIYATQQIHRKFNKSVNHTGIISA